MLFHRLLFWTNIGRTQTIQSSNLDGSSKKAVYSSGFGNLGPIAVDAESRKIFWADLELRRIEYGDFDGSRRQVLVDGQVAEVASLAVHGEHLYWIDKKYEVLERVHKRTGADRIVVKSRMPVLTDVVVVRRRSGGGSKNASKSPCTLPEYGGCSHLCITMPGGAAQCACPVGLVIGTDKHTCARAPSCNAEEFACTSGSIPCIPAMWRCDGIAECEDRSDERNCLSCRHSTDQFLCRNDALCFLSDKRCDGHSDCVDGSDESSCPPCSADDDLVECPSERRCISAELVCDGQSDCIDDSDEADCPRPPFPLTHPVRSATTTHLMIIIACVCVVIIAVVVSAVIYLCRQKDRQCSRVYDRNSLVMVTKGMDSKDGSMVSSGGGEGGCGITPVLSMASSVSTVDRCHSLLSGQRCDHITGASSVSSVTARYPQTLNPPPSPVTTNRSKVVNSPSVVSTIDYTQHSGRCYHGGGRRNHRANHPTTPCSTDVCEDSELFTADTDRHFPSSSDECGYETDPLYPPPPTPCSHYFSDDPASLSCVSSSPSTEKSLYSPFIHRSRRC